MENTAALMRVVELETHRDFKTVFASNLSF
jgi:hypothetical protein